MHKQSTRDHLLIYGELFSPSVLSHKHIWYPAQFAFTFRVLNLQVQKRQLEFYSEFLAMNRFQEVNWFTLELIELLFHDIADVTKASLQFILPQNFGSFSVASVWWVKANFATE